MPWYGIDLLTDPMEMVLSRRDCVSCCKTCLGWSWSGMYQELPRLRRRLYGSGRYTRSFANMLLWWLNQVRLSSLSLSRYIIINKRNLLYSETQRKASDLARLYATRSVKFRTMEHARATERMKTPCILERYGNNLLQLDWEHAKLSFSLLSDCGARRYPFFSLLFIFPNLGCKLILLRCFATMELSCSNKVMRELY